ncbi:MAG: endonuclease/exonuclease/phosphatase family protein [Phototrophicaceae bacterium]
MDRFKVMSFNLRGSAFDDGANVWPARAEMALDLIAKHDPDVIGFQEVQAGNLAALIERFGGAYDFELGTKAITRGDDFHYVPLFWKRRSFFFQAAGSFYLSETPDCWSMFPTGTLIRSATWVRLEQARGEPRPLFLLNSHFDHLNQRAREQSADLVVQQMQALCPPDVPMIFTADSNEYFTSQFLPPDVLTTFHEEIATSGGNTHASFTDAGFIDAFHAAGHTDSASDNTFHDFKGESYPQMGLRIDWILERGLKVEAFEIIRDAQPPVYPSDHYPVLATLAW